MVVRQGVAQVCVGDQVEEGQVLVSGRVPIIGDSEEEINAYMVHADADVVARTTREYEKTIPLLHKERVQTGRNAGMVCKGGEMVIYLPDACKGTGGVGLFHGGKTAEAVFQFLSSCLYRRHTGPGNGCL